MKQIDLATTVLTLAAALFLFAAIPSVSQGQDTGQASSNQAQTDGRRSSSGEGDDPVLAIMKWIKENPVVAGIVIAVVAGGVRGASPGTGGTPAKPTVAPTKPNNTDRQP